MTSVDVLDVPRAARALALGDVQGLVLDPQLLGGGQRTTTIDAQPGVPRQH